MEQKWVKGADHQRAPKDSIFGIQHLPKVCMYWMNRREPCKNPQLPLCNAWPKKKNPKFLCKRPLSFHANCMFPFIIYSLFGSPVQAHWGLSIVRSSSGCMEACIGAMYNGKQGLTGWSTGVVKARWNMPRLKGETGNQPAWSVGRAGTGLGE